MGPKRKDFLNCFTDGLNQSLVSSVAQARLEQDQIFKKMFKVEHTIEWIESRH